MEEATQEKQRENLSEIPAELREVLDEFQNVAEIPTQLPLVHGKKYAINLKHGTNPFSVRPYRYPHKQKVVMETMVTQML